jgi:hypothetical protein
MERLLSQRSRSTIGLGRLLKVIRKLRGTRRLAKCSLLLRLSWANSELNQLAAASSGRDLSESDGRFRIYNDECLAWVGTFGHPVH